MVPKAEKRPLQLSVGGCRMRWWPIFAILALVVLGLRAQAPQALAAATAPPQPAVTVPPDYRTWVYLSAGLSMRYASEVRAMNATGPHEVQPLAKSASGTAVFQNVFVTPAAYRAFLANGHWPDQTMFVLEIRASVDKKSPFLTQGQYQGEIVDLKAELRYDARYPADKWKWFSFAQSGGTWQPAQPEPNAACFVCHTKHGAVDKSFVQFYPTLFPIAKAKGTLNPGFVQ
jgi:hypothetical protein